jgi:hypothetical protein
MHQHPEAKKNFAVGKFRQKVRLVSLRSPIQKKAWRFFGRGNKRQTHSRPQRPGWRVKRLVFAESGGLQPLHYILISPRSTVVTLVEHLSLSHQFFRKTSRSSRHSGWQ